MSKEYKISPAKKSMEYESKIRVQNKKYNSLGVTIPKEIVNLIGLSTDNTMSFKVTKKNDSKVTIDIDFKWIG